MWPGDIQYLLLGLPSGISLLVKLVVFDFDAEGRWVESRYGQEYFSVTSGAANKMAIGIWLVAEFRMIDS